MPLPLTRIRERLTSRAYPARTDVVSDAISAVRLGRPSGGPAVRNYRLHRSRAHPLMAERAEVVRLSATAEEGDELRAALALSGGEVDERRPGSAIALPSLLDLLLVYMVRGWMAGARTGVRPAVLGDPVAAAVARRVGYGGPYASATPRAGSSPPPRGATGRGRRARRAPPRRPG